MCIYPSCPFWPQIGRVSARLLRNREKSHRVRKKKQSMLFKTVLLASAVLAGPLDRRAIFGQGKPRIDEDPTHGKPFRQMPVAVICNNVAIPDHIVQETLRSRRQYGVCEPADHLGISACHVPFPAGIRGVGRDVYMRMNYYDVEGAPNLFIQVTDVEFKVQVEPFEGWQVCEQVKLTNVLPGSNLKRSLPSSSAASSSQPSKNGEVRCGTASWTQRQVETTLDGRNHGVLCPANKETCFVFLPVPTNQAQQAPGFSARIEFTKSPFKVIAAQSIHHGTRTWSECEADFS